MVTIKIKDTTAQAKQMIEFLKTQSYAEVITEKTPNKVTIKALKDAKEGKNLNTYSNSKEMFKKLGI